MSKFNSTAVSGKLFIVATPIGNLGDISERAISTLREVAVIAAEDTRHSKTLLQHFNISTRLVAYHDHSGEATLHRILERIQSGDSVALISDAGTPLISDPGFKLVRAAREAAIPVIPVPGASALVAALSVAGIASDHFTFVGFLAHKSAARQKQLRDLSTNAATQVFYESSHRIVAFIEDLEHIVGGDRQIFIGRELTKKFESHFYGGVAECRQWLLDDADQRKGEFVIVLAGSTLERGKPELKEALRVVSVLREELALTRAVALASRITGVRKNALYEAVLQADEAAK